MTGQELMALRITRKVSRLLLAQNGECTPYQLARFERGKTHKLSELNISRMVKYLNSHNAKINQIYQTLKEFSPRIIQTGNSFQILIGSPEWELASGTIDDCLQQIHTWASN
ncbi:hypothetical protein WA1_50375 [Scytonema hofmannii PCC 7110]|uniref:Uncharacterized protein n=1 Tax=Scytonema hofmannii PCC 7110 TaxID=128403 RepID=A0A139WR73_9CYAN|nr:hypothetical protein [Scytonema hofmannii]KYC34932.1 hypothetical protein WA1_50375 [Scytonema hofmannii PCC 7110]